MKVIISATAPTVYQMQSLHHFNLAVSRNGNGSFTGKKEFETIKEARMYLRDRANMYYDGDKKAIARHLGKDQLTLDAVTASINKLNQ